MVLLLVSSAVLSACGSGISQEDYDAAVVERDAAEAQVASIQATLDAAEAQVVSIQAALDAAQTQVASLETEGDTAEAQIASLEAALDAAQSQAAVLQVTAKYLDVEVALADGYAPGGSCVSAPPGGMGFHYANPGLMEAPLDLLTPQILLYAPTEDGLKLIGVEYNAAALAVTADGPAPWFEEEEPEGWVTSAPSVLGTTFEGPMAGHGPPGTAPWHYDLHVWLWETNPSGMFADFNPNVSCPE
jgi:hypothetical protein